MKTRLLKEQIEDHKRSPTHHSNDQNEKKTKQTTPILSRDKVRSRNKLISMMISWRWNAVIKQL